ncbi:hypothetical protein PsorP6_009536 [Peronosclerospora sorghi]|uniref:Uncharacterized protein n=1 Tax=Peronosclerospora sorghi TaxID=230839 RepID=A0ACC0W002_9STRA|nr:hypothetical protein PsorP6_009536 [Peronosclerospora sorghi]
MRGQQTTLAHANIRCKSRLGEQSAAISKGKIQSMADVETPRVRLVVKGARGIGETQASESDCQVQCGDVVLRTAAIAKTTTPTWCQNFTFGIKKPLDDVVRFKVFGLRELGRDVLLGSASLLMETLTPDTLTTHELALVDANDVTCGHLSVDTTYEPKFMASTLERDADTSKKESMALSAPGSPKTREELSPLLMEKESAGMEPSPTTQVSSV